VIELDFMMNRECFEYFAFPTIYPAARTPPWVDSAVSCADLAGRLDNRPAFPSPALARNKETAIRMTDRLGRRLGQQ
jgi:hypothetical protein